MHAWCLIGSGGTFFATPFDSTPRRHDAFLPAAFSFADWHLLGGFKAISLTASLTNASALFSIVVASPGVEHVVPVSAFVNAAENLSLQACVLIGSGARFFAVAFDRTLS